MYKIYTNKFLVPGRHIQKLFLIMRLTTILLIVAIMQVSAGTFAQKVSLSEKNTSLAKVIKKISRQTGFGFFVNTSLLSNTRPVTIDVSNAELNEVLKTIFKDQPLKYRVDGKSIIVSEREKSVVQRISEYLLSSKVKGHVTDSLGNPLIGATVQLEGEQGMSYGTFTDAFGNFEFAKVTAGNYKLKVSYIGYQAVERAVIVNDKDFTIDVTMRSQFTTLKTVSVVNTGYQQISAERMTGAFDNIRKSQLEKPNTNIAERLVGTTAGMQVKLDVDGNPTIQVRGQTTLNANSTQGANMPLIVIDGFPLSTGSSNPFNTINPNDVESVTVLKDAAAASIWGAKSANGVIVITTKKGNRDTPLKIDVSAFTRFSAKQNVSYMTGLAGSAETVDFEQLSYKKWGGYVNSGFIYDNYRESYATVLLNENNLGYLTTAQLNAGLAQLKAQDNRGQISDYLLDNPANTQYNLTLSGGNQRMANLVSMLYERNQSNFKGTDNKKYSINYRTNANVFKWLDLDLSGTYQFEKANNNGLQLYDIKQLSPYDMLKNPDGSLTDIYQYYQPTMLRSVPLSNFPYSFNYNPIQEITNRDYSTTNKNARVQAGLTFKLLPGLTYRSSIQYENFDQYTRAYNNDQTFSARNEVNTTSSWDQTPTGSVTRNLPLGGTMDQGRSTVEAYNFRNQVNFAKIFSEKHEINLVAGSEISNSVGKGSSYPRTYGYDDQTLSVGSFPNGLTGTSGWNGFSNNFSYLSSYTYRTQRFNSLFANAAYTYSGKYTISGSYRTDASNLIASDPKYRYSPFYSAGLGYDIGKETFMKSLTWLDRLNLRATYGRTGNVDLSTSPFTLITQQPASPYTNDPIARISQLGNPTLTWEKTQTLNLGLDFSLWNSKLYGKVDVYNKKGKNLLASISLPTVLGTSFASFNNAAIANKGIEVTLGTVLPLKGNDIVWNGNFNLSYNESKVTTLINSTYNVGSLVQGGSGAYAEGYDPNTAWAYQYAGVVNGSPMIQGPNGTLVPLNSYLSGDGRPYLQNMGTKTPPYVLGLSNSFKVYDFNLSFIIIAKFGAVFQGQYFNYPSSGFISLPNSKLSSVLNGDPAKIATLPADPNNTGYGNWIATNRFLNYSYLSANLARLQEVNVSYNLPRKWLSKINFSSAQVILQGNNLYTWLANNTGEDPEFPIGTVKPRAQVTLGIKFQL